MNKRLSEIYARIVSAPVGSKIPTVGSNGVNYGQDIESILHDQGYKRGVSFNSSYDYNEHCTVIEKLADVRAYEEPRHNINVGEIFYNSWGYDQTNIDFYQVVSVTEKTVSIRAIRAEEAENDYSMMTGKKSALKDNFFGDIIRKTPFFFMGRWCLNFKHGGGGLWDGKPMRYSWYA